MKLADPTNLPRGARRFVAFWLRDIAVGHDQRGALSLVPLRLLVCVGVGVTAGGLVAVAFLGSRSEAIGFYAALLAVNAILLAVCWAAFAKIYDTVGDPEFGRWLRQTGALGYYDFYVEFIQLVQAIAVLTVLAALVLAVVDDVPLLVSRVAFGGTIASSVYAGWWANGCVRIMQDLVDHRNAFVEREARPNIRTFSR